MQMVERRWDGKDGLILRLATVESEPSPSLTQRLIEAVYAARATYPEVVELGHVHPLAIEWVRPADLVVRPRTGKLVQVIDERPHD